MAAAWTETAARKGAQSCLQLEDDGMRVRRFHGQLREERTAPGILVVNRAVEGKFDILRSHRGAVREGRLRIEVERIGPLVFRNVPGRGEIGDNPVAARARPDQELEDQQLGPDRHIVVRHHRLKGNHVSGAGHGENAATLRRIIRPCNGGEAGGSKRRRGQPEGGTLQKAPSGERERAQLARITGHSFILAMLNG